MLPPWPPKDPGENPLDYDINWTPRLANADGSIDTIATSAWSITVGDGALTIISNAFTPTRTKVWLSGGTLGLTYSLKNNIISAGGRDEIETVKLRIRAK
jgi:hypothetical protein